MALALYRGVVSAAAPVIRRYIAHRVRIGKEDPDRVGERFGRPSKPRPPGPLIWIHAASVGESLSILPAIGRVDRDWPGLSILLTTGTLTSARLLARRLPARVVHQFAPFDQPAWVAAFLDHWRPGLAIRMESELWPVALDALAARGVPAVLVNARMSSRSLRNWRRLPGTARRLLGVFALCLAQSEADAANFRKLGAPDVRCLGNLKHAAPPLPVDTKAFARLRTQCAGRTVWLGASTHQGEEERLADAHRAVRDRVGDALLVIVPRHPERGAEIARDLRQQGHAVALRSAGEAPNRAIYIADGLGELGLFYRLATVSFVGGSLAPHGGHNLLEPARLDCAILHGPHMVNFAEIAAEFAAARASETVESEAALARAVIALATDPALRRRRTEAASRIAHGKEAILDAVIAAIAPLLDGAAQEATRHADA